MHRIEFIAKQARETHNNSTFVSGDENTYSVSYEPIWMKPRRVEARISPNFSTLLLETFCGLPKNNPGKESIQVSLDGNFPQEHIYHLQLMFDMYSEAYGVKVEYQKR